MFFLELDIGRRVIRRFGAMLCDVIYSLIADIYQLFITVARLNILSSDQIAPIYQRITMILTIVMTFYITFEFVKYTIQPDTITDKEKGAGNILKRIIIVIILIAFTPQLFSMAYKLQNRIIETQLISKVILGTTNNNYTTYGNEFSANMLNLFYYVDESACSSNTGDCNDARKAVDDNLNHLRTTGDSDIVVGINLSAENSIFKETNPAISFNGFLAIIVGGFIVYILAMYSIDVGTRYAQLIFLQIISPIAVMGYMLPKKDGIFQKWGKQCITTYIDLFLRIAIISFVLLIIKVLGDGFDSGRIFDGIEGVSGTLKTFTYIVLVMGLLVFAQRAPKLLGELFPSSGAAGIGMGLGAKGRLEPTKKAFKGFGDAVGGGRRVAGGVGGAIAGFVKGGKNGRLKGALEGAKAGSSKNRKGLLEGSLTRRIRAASAAGEGVHEAIEDFRNDAPAGSKVSEAMLRSEHWKNELRELDRRKANMEAYSKAKSAAEANVKDMKFMKQLEGAKAIAQAANNSEAASLIESKMSEIKKLSLQYSIDGSEATLNKLKANLDEIKSKFAPTDNVNFETEENDKAKWGNIKVSVEQASKIAVAVSQEKTKAGTTVAANLKGEGMSADGRITDMAKFAYKMGAFEDAVKNANNTLTTSDEYKQTQAYAKGINGSGGSGK